MLSFEPELLQQYLIWFLITCCRAFVVEQGLQGKVMATSVKRWENLKQKSKV